jgi:hypothetical protein
MPPITGDSTKPNIPGVLGKSTTFNGILGFTTADSQAGVAGICDEGTGNGVYGRSKNRNGVLGFTTGEGHAGVAGACDEGNGNGVYGRSKNRNGVYGISTAAEHSGVVGENDNGTGVLGRSKNSVGVWGLSDTREGVIAQTRSGSTAALAVYQSNPDSNTAALYAKHDGHRLAAVFEGDVEVTGDIRLSNADCAEDFDVIDMMVEPGTIMILADENGLSASHKAYDKRVIGVVSGAGEYKPGIVLDKQKSDKIRKPIALLGKVYCKVDAQYGSIEIGDLLTTSHTPGHAMLASDSSKAPGAVIGKALKSFNSGKGIIPIVIALQ